MSQPILGRIEQLTFSPVPYNQKKPDDAGHDKRQDEINRELFKQFDEKSGVGANKSVELTDADCEEFERLVAPLVEFLQTKCHPHMSVIVEYDHAALVEEVRSVPFKVPD